AEAHPGGAAVEAGFDAGRFAFVSGLCLMRVETAVAQRRSIERHEVDRRHHEVVATRVVGVATVVAEFVIGRGEKAMLGNREAGTGQPVAIAELPAEAVAGNAPARRHAASL